MAFLLGGIGLLLMVLGCVFGFNMMTRFYPFEDTKCINMLIDDTS